MDSCLQAAAELWDLVAVQRFSHGNAGGKTCEDGRATSYVNQWCGRFGGYSSAG